MSNDTPTERFDAPEAPRVDDKKKKSKGLILLLSIIGGVLLIAVVVLLTLLLSGGLGGQAASPSAEQGSSASPSPSDTASASPSETSSPTPIAEPSSEPSSSPSATTAPPPPSNKTAINQFTVSPKTVLCNTSGAPGITDPLISFTWKTTNVNQVGFGAATDDALLGGMGWNLPPSGTSQADFPPGYTEFPFPCAASSATYTLTVNGPDGKVSKKVTVTNNGDQ